MTTSMVREAIAVGPTGRGCLFVWCGEVPTTDVITSGRWKRGNGTWLTPDLGPRMASPVCTLCERIAPAKSPYSPT